MRKLIHIVGNRPQFIKLAVLHNYIAKHSQIEQQILHTGQHYSNNMSAIFFEELEIPEPTKNFNIISPTQNLFIANASDALEEYFGTEKNVVALVYGDTNTTLAAAIAASRTGTPLLHFEAGVRTYDNQMPEELNRIITDKLATINYCCTQKNMDTAFAESITNTILTGDLMLDAFNNIHTIIEANEKINTTKGYIACTVHRAANLSSKENLSNIIQAINEINKTTPVYMPVHPHTQKKITEYNLQPSFNLLEPLGYPAMKKFLQESEYVITDSGGTSREAYFCKKKSLILMDTVFWPEILEVNCSINSLVKENNIIEDFEKLKILDANFDTEVFGNGNASKNILTHLTTYL